MLSKHCVSLVRSHVEQTLCLAEAARDVVVCLIGITVVNFGELRVVVDQQQRRGDADDGA